ncbi:hypothetical protein ALC60_04061 [Trachymyrmex zeteki]|uniref:Uncharacterized protein n=1 Tax=Mycetomoellerius zeteki TaxID=64791 RepID=A0A151X9M8_9HYME|nr:hypothetical protein ALC60_04061 [Trachymyrmex zeteki]
MNAMSNELAGEQREAEESDNIVELLEIEVVTVIIAKSTLHLQFVTAYIGSPNAAKRKIFDKRARRREGRRPANKRARPDITVAVDASGYSFT